MIARRAVSLQNRKRQRPEFVPGFQSADKGFGPRLEHLTTGAAHDHAYDAGFERAAVAVPPVAVEGERQWPQPQEPARMAPKEA